MLWVSVGACKNTTEVPFFVLNLGFNIIDGVRRLHLEGDGLSGESLDEDLHAEQKASMAAVIEPGSGDAHSTK
jgi:hypothetical protein